jgi:hypothetical protein
VFLFFVFFCCSASFTASKLTLTLITPLIHAPYYYSCPCC